MATTVFYEKEGVLFSEQKEAAIIIIFMFPTREILAGKHLDREDIGSHWVGQLALVVFFNVLFCAFSLRSPFARALKRSPPPLPHHKLKEGNAGRRHISYLSMSCFEGRKVLTV